MKHKSSLIIALILVMAFLAIGAAAFSPGNLFCKQSDENTGDCVTIWNGGNISVYNNQGGARKFYVEGDSGNVTVAGRLTTSGNLTTSGSVAAIGNLTTSGNVSAGGNIGASGHITTSGNITASGNITTSGNLTTGGIIAAGGAMTTTQLYINGSPQSGAVRFGASSVYTTGASITHGFTVTPTVCILSPGVEITATYSISSTSFSVDTATRATPIYWMCGK